mgnify:FL=1
MSASLRSPKPAGAREPVSGSGQVAVSERGPVVHRRRGRLALIDSSGPAGQVALRGGLEQSGGRSTAPESGMAERDRCSHPDPGSHYVPGERVERPLLVIAPERPGGVVLSSRRGQPSSQPGARLGCRRGVAGLVVVCVLALGAAACSVKDAKAEASVSASASASAAIARAEKGIADANASATASREAALTPELRAKRDAALAEPAPAKPSQMNEETPEGAASSVRYFLDLYRYAFMTGNTTELAAMSDDRCKFCKSTIDDANDIHSKGGWADKWDQEIVGMTYYEKLEGYEYNRVKVIVNYGAMASYYGDGQNPTTSEPTNNQEVNFGVRYNNGRWMVGAVEAVSK